MNSKDSCSSKFHQDNKFFEVHLKLLQLTGILPRSGSYTPWKQICYDIFPVVAIVWCVPPLVSLLFSIYENWGDISVVTGMVFQLSFTSNCIGIYVYLILNRKPLENVISVSEVTFARHIKRLDLNRMGIYDAVMAKACRQNTVLTRTILTINFIGYIFWTILPFILWCATSKNEIQNLENSEINNSYDDGQWKYFCYRMWLPENATQTPMYQVIYTYQALENSFVILTHTLHIMITISLMLHLTSQFKVLTTCLEIIDDVPLRLKGIKTSEDNVFGTKSKEYSDSGKEKNVTRRNRNAELREKCEMLYREDIEERVESDRFEMLKMKDDDEIYCYLVNCVKYHQLLLQNAEDMNKLLSPMLFIDFMVGLAMMCTTTFQVAVESEQGMNIKIVAAAISAWYPIFLICWFGERLSEQSLRVQQASYRCRWYIRSPRFKRILFFLIMRAQKPVQFNAGSFFIVSLEKFADMANTVYAYYTVLKRMHES